MLQLPFHNGRNPYRSQNGVSGPHNGHANAFNSVVSGLPQPSLNLDFINGTTAAMSWITFTRATSAWRFNDSLNIEEVTSDNPRFDYDPASNYVNLIPNSMMVGGAAPTTLPTGWIIAGGGIGTLSREYSYGTIDGVTYFDARYYGTTSTTSFNLACVASAGDIIPAALSQAYTQSVSLALVGGTTTNISAVRLSLLTRTTAGVAVEGFVGADQKASLTSEMQRFSVTGTVADPTTTGLQPTVNITFSSGVDIDITLRIAMPQCQPGSTATTFIPTTTIRKASVEACRGFLIDEQRTNSIRNAVMTGAVAGAARTVGTISGLSRTASTTVVVASTGHNVIVGDTITVSGASVADYNGTFVVSAISAGVSYSYVSASSATDSATGYTVSVVSVGTSPTNQAISAFTGGARTIVGTGTESGISYVEVRFVGITTAVTATLYSSDLSTQIAALQNQVWSQSMYLRLTSGSLSGVTAKLRTSECDGAGASLASNDSAALTITSAALATQRNTLTATLGNASTAFVLQQLIVTGLTIGQAYDFTLRIGAPQLELGAFATSPILSAGAATTRNADVATINTLTPWFNASEGTLYSEAKFTNIVSYNTTASFGDGTANNTIRTIQWNDGTDRIFSVSVGGVSQAGFVGTGQVGTAKFAGAYKLNDFNASKNGSIGTTDTSGTIPTVTTLFIGQTGSGAIFPLNGWLKRVTYYPRRLPNAQLQALTT